MSGFQSSQNRSTFFREIQEEEICPIKLMIWLLRQELFRGGLYCSEAILQAYNRYLNLGLNEAGLRMASGFGAGLGAAKCTCGSLTGAVLVVGALRGRINTGESEKEVFELTKELHDHFKERFKATCCRVLTREVEWGTKEHSEFCTRYVHGAVEILEEVLNRNKNQ